MVDGVDLNGDGTKDIVIGGMLGDVTNGNGEGWAYVVYGKSSGWTTPYSLSTIY
jgi:hypothetical protein